MSDEVLPKTGDDLEKLDEIHEGLVGEGIDVLDDGDNERRQLDQPVEINRVHHGQFLDQLLHETGNDEALALGLESALLSRQKSWSSPILLTVASRPIRVSSSLISIFGYVSERRSCSSCSA